jgi:hypothetical protein
VFVAKGNDKRETGSAREREGEREGGREGRQHPKREDHPAAILARRRKRERESLGDEGPL